MITFYLVLRILNVLLYCGVVSGVIMHWRLLPDSPEMPRFRASLVALLAASSYATIELAFSPNVGGLRLIFLFAALLALFRSLYLRVAQRLWNSLITGRRRTMWDKRADRKP